MSLYFLLHAFTVRFSCLYSEAVSSLRVYFLGSILIITIFDSVPGLASNSPMNSPSSTFFQGDAAALRTLKPFKKKQKGCEAQHRNKVFIVHRHCLNVFYYFLHFFDPLCFHFFVQASAVQRSGKWCVLFDKKSTMFRVSIPPQEGK